MPSITKIKNFIREVRIEHDRRIADSLGGGTSDVMTGATASTSGTSGLVPTPSAGDNEKYLRGNGEWAIPTNTTYSAATTTTSGLMSADDKKKLNNLASITTAGDNITISGGTIKSANTTYSAGSNITINGTTISGTPNTTYSAGTGIAVNSNTISISLSTVSSSNDGAMWIEV